MRLHWEKIFSFTSKISNTYKDREGEYMEICGTYRARFADSPIWHKAYGVIWLDIANKKIITYNPETEKEDIYDAMGWIKSIIPTKDGQFIGVYKDGLYLINFKLSIKKPFVLPPDLTDLHFLNDSKCGPDGRLWVGTTDGFFKKFKETPQTVYSNYPFENAKLISISTEGEIQTHLSKLAISSGLEWDRKTNKFYHIDSSKHAIFQYVLTEKGQLLFEKIVYSFKMDEGYPDGMTIDSEGNLYVTLFKSSLMAKTSKEQTRVICIDPQEQQIKEEYIIPISHVTSCTIGGKNLETLFITTAYEALPETRIKEEPLAGYLLQIPIKTIGVMPYEFAIANIESII
jgi:sugar lactone lactonase YvrE